MWKGLNNRPSASELVGGWEDGGEGLVSQCVSKKTEYMTLNISYQDRNEHYFMLTKQSLSKHSGGVIIDEM